MLAPAVANPSILYCHWNVLGPVLERLKFASSVLRETLWPGLALTVSWRNLLFEVASLKVPPFTNVSELNELAKEAALIPAPRVNEEPLRFASVVVELNDASLPTSPLVSQARIGEPGGI